MPNSPTNPREGFLSKRLAGARFLDLDEVASPHELGLKHMMPQGRVFADVCERFGIDPSSHVVIYDTQGVFSSPRALFMFRAFGHHNSSVLDGGLPRWEAEGFPIETQTPAEVERSNYPMPTFDAETIRSYEQMVSNASQNPSTDPTAELVVDARSHGRYLGIDPEPRPGLSSGHIPHSFSLPFGIFLQTHSSPNSSIHYTTYLSPSEIHKALVDAIGAEQTESVIKGERPIITSCGSGMTAGVLWLGLKLLGIEKVRLYDESWTGYAARSSSVIEKSQ
jgi:thiosulfate/3-mercaptopyruvate sulfurtransferase